VICNRQSVQQFESYYYHVDCTESQDIFQWFINFFRLIFNFQHLSASSLLFLYLAYEAFQLPVSLLKDYSYPSLHQMDWFEHAPNPPRDFRTCLHCYKGMHWNPVSPDDFFCLKFREYPSVSSLVCPSGICHAMNLYQVEIISVQLFLKRSTTHPRWAVPVPECLLANQIFVPRYSFPLESASMQRQCMCVFRSYRHSRRSGCPFHMPAW